MLTIIVPMAGAGSRFTNAGYADPKPLIPVNGVPMIQLVISNLRPAAAHRFVFICQEKHIKAYGLREKLQEWAPGCAIVGLNAITEGAACTVLAASEHIPKHEPLMIANSDQYVDVNIDNYLKAGNGLDGLIMTMRADDAKWSFVGLNEQAQVTRVVEKEVISNEATVGIYNFKRASDFIEGAERMIAKNLRVNNEFYVAPVYNEMIADQKHIGIYNIGAVGDGMYGLGTPADLDAFLPLPIAQKARARAA